MEDNSKIIEQLNKKIERLTQQHQFFYEEIQKLQQEVSVLKAVSDKVSIIQEEITTSLPPVKETILVEPVYVQPVYVQSIADATVHPINKPPKQIASSSLKTPLEDFIGTNLLNKVGIAVLVIGIGFGTKYAIDHQLLSPLTRIILAYLSCIIIIGFAIKLKKKYESFSAVLLSGGMATLYFVTYAAYGFYDLIPQAVAFGLMVLFTVFTAFAALQYNMQVIAIIGLVGAYAVPFLLSDGSGRAEILFSYMSIINTGIMVLAFKKYWEKLYYLAFGLTWLIFAVWYAFDYNYPDHFWISMVFATFFFLVFYVTFLSYKIFQKEALSKWDVLFVLLNSFLYFSYGYLTINSRSEGEQFLGLFTVFTALIHFIGSVIIYKKQKDASQDIFYLVAGLVLVFITLAVPIQLEGNWVTLVWATEAILLFWIGRTKAYAVYEKLSYVLIFLAACSLVQDWSIYYRINTYNNYQIENPGLLFINIQFFTSLWVIASLSIVLALSLNKKYTSPVGKDTALDQIVTLALPALVGMLLYFTIFKEVQAYWDQRYSDSYILIKDPGGDYSLYDEDLQKFKTLWLINYSAIFGLMLSITNLKFFKSKILSHASVAFNALVVTCFLTVGLVELSSLRTTYLNGNAEYYLHGIYYILIRYVSIFMVLPLVVCNYWYIRKTSFFEGPIKKIERILFHLVILTLLSSELVQLLNMMQIKNSFKLSLSILWGSYALFLIIIGLWRNQKHIRFTAIILFGITLLKLFIYDMADMSTISKTIVMMILGVLLLTASFLYNKVKHTNENS